MKQLHIREPWADLAYRSGDRIMDDLLNRIQILEDKVRQLEAREKERPSEPPATSRETKISVRKRREAVPVGV